jgi:RAD50-interacting protein 1
LLADRYASLPRFNHRLQFLVSIQFPLLEYYRSRISVSLDAFEALSSAFARAMPGALGVSLGGNEEGSVNVDVDKLTSGVEGVQRLSKAFLSAKFILAAMRIWGEELVGIYF